MDGTRTKLVCNLSLDDFFTYPDTDGTWRRTNNTHIVGKKYYECRQLENSERKMLLQANERVELIKRGG